MKAIVVKSLWKTPQMSGLMFVGCWAPPFDFFKAIISPLSRQEKAEVGSVIMSMFLFDANYWKSHAVNTCNERVLLSAQI